MCGCLPDSACPLSSSLDTGPGSQVSETEREDLEESEKTQYWVERLCQTRLQQISSSENEIAEVTEPSFHLDHPDHFRTVHPEHSKRSDGRWSSLPATPVHCLQPSPDCSQQVLSWGGETCLYL